MALNLTVSPRPTGNPYLPTYCFYIAPDKAAGSTTTTTFTFTAKDDDDARRTVARTYNLDALQKSGTSHWLERVTLTEEVIPLR